MNIKTALIVAVVLGLGLGWYVKSKTNVDLFSFGGSSTPSTGGTASTGTNTGTGSATGTTQG